MRLLCLFVFVVAVVCGVPVRAYTQSIKSGPRLQTLWRKEHPRGILFAPADYDTATKPGMRTVAQVLSKNKLVARSCGAITAISNKTVKIGKTRFPTPKSFDDMPAPRDVYSATYELLASLSVPQWRLIASPKGLGLENLSAKQKEIWERAMPYTFLVAHGIDPSNFSSTAKRRQIPQAARKQIRIRVKLVGSAYTQNQGLPNPEPALSANDWYSRAQRGETVFSYQSKPSSDFDDYQPHLVTVANQPPALPPALKARLDHLILNLPKNAQSFAFSDRLLRRMENVAGVEFLSRPDWEEGKYLCTGGRVPASDLLQAFLFATDATLRYFPATHPGEKAFCLTMPVGEPEGQLNGRWYDLPAAIAQAKARLESRASTRIAAADPVPLLQYDADDPIRLPNKLRPLLFDAARKGATAGLASVPLTVLPAASQRIILQKKSRSADYKQDTVLVTASPALSYVVSGSGKAVEINGDVLAQLADWLPEAEGDAREAKGRIVIVSPKTTAEATTLAKAARHIGVKELWVQGSPDVVAAAVQSAGNMPVRVAVSLFYIAPDTPAALPRDENIYGMKSQEWLVPDDPAVRAYTVKRIRAAVAIPGTAGIALMDTVPPGYRGSSKPGQYDSDDRSGDVPPGAGLNEFMGYTPGHRRDFYGETGKDPIDFTAYSYQELGGNPTVIDWDEDRLSLYGWRPWLKKSLLPLWDEIRAVVAKGHKPVLFGGEALFGLPQIGGSAAVETFVAWEMDKREPPFETVFRIGGSTGPNLVASPVALTAVVGNHWTTAKPETLLEVLYRKESPELIVWDLTNPALPGVGARLTALKRSATSSK